MLRNTFGPHRLQDGRSRLAVALEDSGHMLVELPPIPEPPSP
ncbi:MAG: hypothetical protein ACK54F_10380 [Planctomycetia bacterium]